MAKEKKEIGQECKNCGEIMVDECFIHDVFCQGCEGECPQCEEDFISNQKD